MSETTVHTLVAKGAAFTDDYKRVDPTGTGGVGKAACGCGWLSDELPSGKQRMLAHRSHKENPEPVEEPVEEPVTNEADEATEPEPEPVEQDETPAEPVFRGHRDFLGNYAIEMVPFAGRVADAAGMSWTSENFKGELRRRVYVEGEKAKVKDFLRLLDDIVAEAMTGLKSWQKEHRDERRGKTDQQLYVANRTFLREFGERAAEEIS